MPTPSLTFEDVAVGDGGEPMMTVDRFEITIELMPLLQGQFRIISMRLDRPRMRVVVGDDGTLDWQARNAASQALDPENVILEHLEIVDGRIDYSDPAAETELAFAGVNAVVEARSLLGPWRIEGSYLDEGVAVPFRIATGRRLDDGTIRVKTDLSPPGWPVALVADGVVGIDEGGLAYDGTYNLTEILTARPPPEGGGSDGAREAVGWRSEGTFRLTRRQLAITQAVLSAGPPERPHSIAGSLSVDLGASPRFEAHASARQIDLDRSLGQGPAEPVEVTSAVGSLVEWLTNSFVPPIPGSVFFNVPGIVVGGAVIQDVAFEVRPTIGGWRLASFIASLPGRATLEARGVLATDFEVGFAGDIRLVVNQPALFATWWRGRSQGGAGRFLAPFEIAGRAELSPQEFALEGVDAIFGDAAVRGRFAWSEAITREHRRMLEAELVADRLDFTQLRAFVELFAGEDLARTTVLADSYDIKLSAGSFQLDDVAMHDVAVDASYAEDTLTVNEFSIGDLGGAQIDVTQGRIESLSERPRGHLDAQLEADTLDGLTRVVERVLPGHALSRWLRKAGSSLAPAFLTASVEAPAREGNADIRAILSGVAASTTLSAAIELSGALADWREGTAGVEIVLDSPDAAELARQAGMTVARDSHAGGAHLEIDATGVPAAGLDARIAGDLGGIGLRSSGRLTLAAEAPPAYGGSIAAASDDVEPLLRMLDLGIPVAAIGNAARIDGDIEIVGRTVELALRNSQVADRLVNGRLSLARSGEDAWAVGGDIHVDAVDLGWLTTLGLGFALDPTGDPAAPWSRAPFGEPGHGAVSGKIAVSTDALAVGDGLDAVAATLTLDLQPNRLAVDLAGSTAVGGALTGGLSIHNVGGNARVAGRFDLKGATLEQLVWWRGGRAVATGVLDLSAEFEAAGRSPAALASSLTGGGAVAVRDGEARYMSPQAARLVIRASDLGQEFTENELRDAFTRQIDAGSFAFERAEGAFSIAAGVVRLKSIAVEGADMKASGNAAIDLTRLAIDSDWTVTFDPGDDRVEGTVPQVGIVFRGPLAAPERLVDVLQLGSYLNIRQEERLLELLSQAEADRLEADRLNREKRKLREDAERRARKAAEAEAARIAAEAEARRLAAEAAARRAADEAERIAAEAERRRQAAEEAVQEVAVAEAARDSAIEEAERARAEAARRAGSAEAAVAKAVEEEAARAAAEEVVRRAADVEAAQTAVAAQAASVAADAGRQHSAAEDAVAAARDVQAARVADREQAAAALAEAKRQLQLAQEAASAAVDETAARTAAEAQARQSAIEAEQRRAAAEEAAETAASDLTALVGAEVAARRLADEAEQRAAESAQGLTAAREAVLIALEDVGMREAAKRVADEEVGRVLAEAGELLRPSAQASGDSEQLETAGEEEIGRDVTQEEAAELRTRVTRMRSAAEEADRALAQARAAYTLAEEAVARLADEAERSRVAAAAAVSRAAEATAARNAGEARVQTAQANVEAMRSAAGEASRLADEARAARVAAAREAARLADEATRLAGEVEVAETQVAEAEAARGAAEAEVARLEAEAERLQRTAEEAASTAAGENAAREDAVAERARLAAEAEERARAAEQAAAAADAAGAAHRAAEEAATRLAAEAERRRTAVEAAARAAEHAAQALKLAEEEAARIAAEAEQQRLAAEEATRNALEVSVPR